MRSGHTLAFLADPESASRVPDTSRIVPLSPRVRVDRSRLIAEKPEGLLSEVDFRDIDSAAPVVASGWWRAAPPAAFPWRELDVGDCFSYDLRFVARDLLKADLVTRRALEQFPADGLATDVPPIGGPFPPYPYMAGIGSLLERFAASAGLPLLRLYAPQGRKARARPALLARVYGALASRKALAQLRSGHPIVGVGSFPETYGPIAEAWSAGNGSMVVVSSLFAPLRAAPAKGLYFAPLEAFSTIRERGSIEASVARCVASIPAALPPGVAHSGGKEFESVFLAEVRARLQRQIGDIIRLSMAFERGLDRASRLVLLETHSPVSKAAVRWGRSRDIPVVAVQHGVIAYPQSYKETEADRIAAWGPLDAAWFSENLSAQVQVNATGNPRYDRLASPRPTGGSVVNVPRGLRPILFASSPFGHFRSADSPRDHEALQSIVIEALSEVEEAFLLFKRHPAERPGALPAGSKADARRVRQIVGGDTLGMIQSSDLVITVGSTVALEAMYLGRPVVFLGPADPASPFHPPEDGGGLRATNQAEMVECLRRLLRDEAFRERVLEGQRAFLAQAYAPLDGRAADRVVALLRSG